MLRSFFDGLKWGGLGQLIRQFISLSVSIYLIRNIVPNDFGLIAIASVFLGVGYLISELGLSTALIQKKHVSIEEYNTVFIINLTFASTLYLIVFLCAPIIADRYENLRLVYVLRLSAINIILTSLLTVPKIKLTRKLRFKQLNVVDVVSLVFTSLLVLLMVVLDYHLEALIVQTLGFTSVCLVGYFYYEPYYFKPHFNFNEVKKLFGFSSHYFVNRILSYTTKNIDVLLISTFVGVVAGGVYSKSRSFYLGKTSMLVKVLSSVLFPVLNKTKKNDPKFGLEFLSLQGILAYYLTPLLVVVGLSSVYWIPFLFGTEWIAAGAYFQLMSLNVYALITGSIHPSVYLSLGKTKLQLIVAGGTKIVTILSIIFSLRWGIEEMIVVSGSVNILMQYVHFYIIERLLIGSGFQFIVRQLPALIFTLLTLFICYRVDFGQAFHISLLLCYLLLMFIFGLKSMKVIVNGLKIV